MGRLDRDLFLVNFYLLVAGVVASAVIAVPGENSDLPKAVGTLLLWLQAPHPITHISRGS